MKILNPFLAASVLVWMASGIGAFAKPTPDPSTAQYGVNLSASLSTESVSGTVSTVHTVHVNNQSIAAAVFASGTTSVLKASDLALVINNRELLSVIDTTSTNHTVVAVIAQTGTSTHATAVGATSRSELTVAGALSDYEFTLPSVTGTQVTNFRITAGVSQATGLVSKLFISFSGGQGDETAASTYFQGTIRQTGKIYSP